MSTSSDDECLVPEMYRDQIGRRYRSPSDVGYVRRRKIVQEFVRQLALKREVLTFEKIEKMLRQLDRGHLINSKTISYDLERLREDGKVDLYHLNSHRVTVEDDDGERHYTSIRDAARQEGCSVEGARKWLLGDGKPNRKGQVWTYFDPETELSTANSRKKRQP